MASSPPDGLQCVWGMHSGPLPAAERGADDEDPRLQPPVRRLENYVNNTRKTLRDWFPLVFLFLFQFLQLLSFFVHFLVRECVAKSLGQSAIARPKGVANRTCLSGMCLLGLFFTFISPLKGLTWRVSNPLGGICGMLTR